MRPADAGRSGVFDLRAIRAIFVRRHMRLILRVTILAAGVAMVTAAPLLAQNAEDPETLSRLVTLVTEAPGTPGGRGLLSVAIAEARTALAQAVLAEKASGDAKAMRQYGAAVLHAVNPSLQAEGPGLGYGLRRAVLELIAQIEAVTIADRKADVAQLMPRAMNPAREALQATEALMVAAQRLAVASSVDEATTLSRHVRELSGSVLAAPNVTPAQPRAARGLGGLSAVQSNLAILMLGRNGTLPAAVTRTSEPRR
jgi:hypothetical protein